MKFIESLVIKKLLRHMQCLHKIGRDVSVIMKCTLVSCQHRC